MASAQILTNGKALYAYNGTEWVPLNTTGNLVNSTRWQYTAVGSETSLSGNDDNGESLIYTPGYEQVYLNGVLLARDADYTATTGTTITGLTALTAGYIVEIIAYNNINVGNTYTQGQIDNKIANTFTRWIDTLSASATVLSGLDDNSTTLSYTPGLEQVYVNGILLLPSEYTATSGSTVVLSEAAVSGDVIQIYTLKNFRVPNTYTIGQTDDQFLTKTSASNTYTPLSSPVTSFKNKIINSEFDIWQRGTSFNTNGAYTADRWQLGFSGTSASVTTSRVSFTPGNEISNYESEFFIRNAVTGGTGTSALSVLTQKIEDVRTLAGQTITVSFWAKAASGTPSIGLDLYQEFGSGGSATVGGQGASKFQLSTSWQRFTKTLTLASISGKTIGASSLLATRFWFSSGSDYNSLNDSLGIQSNTFDIWGVQVEKGSIATEFEQKFIGDELRLCQRYYHRITSTSGSQPFLNGHNPTTTVFFGVYNFPVSMRIPPTSIDTTGTAGDYHITHSNTNTTCNAVPTLQESTTLTAGVRATVASGLTAGHGSAMRNQNSVVYLGWSAEL
jgi:hypothetical protein